ncbi:non-heme iron oxygenase ferredoxin subunit [Actinomadura barringtoniae]|uniref:Non-heme iron oxygenase ferredoxin subunit n=1 Tax=Actinomadura barringtoniae TaxID=1427535 RepID=A0A939PA35_9ACTN|nr:non-heme iron oxygenase ferredoxin subunit [Actinomadura barringtoniae]MBO2448745.1 non-heme iron oxygenase ferredoxin subunit [Actinomadura barringtoniae]
MEGMQQTTQAVRVCTVAELSDGEAVRVPPEETGTGAISVFNDGGEFYALDDACTHVGASLAEGYIEDGEVVCPWHGSRFCLLNGELEEGPATEDLRSYGVEVRDGSVWLLLEDTTGR